MRRAALAAVALAAACSNSTITPSSGAAACASAVACGLLGQSDIQTCSSGVLALNNPAIAQLYGVKLTTAQVNCLAVAGSNCTAAQTCLNDGQTPSSCTTPGPQSCMGTFLQSCSDENGQNLTSQFDCSFYGEMCVAGSGRPGCGTGTCSGAPNTCVGNTLQSCDADGILHQFDCAQFGALCNTAVTAHCQGAGPSCTGPLIGDQTLRCDGTKLVSCTFGNESTLDCASIQLKCIPNIKNAHAACALGSDCDPANTSTVTCNGTKLNFCNNGIIDSYDCKSGGFATCDPSGGGRCK
jgi:hypothetical protein